MKLFTKNFSFFLPDPGLNGIIMRFPQTSNQFVLDKINYEITYTYDGFTPLTIPYDLL